jgi:hypothetical protein
MTEQNSKTLGPGSCGAGRRLVAEHTFERLGQSRFRIHQDLGLSFNRDNIAIPSTRMAVFEFKS